MRLKANALYRLQSERQLGQRSLENSSQAYDKQLLSKIGGPNTPTRGGGAAPANYLSSSGQEPSTSPHNSLSKLNGQLKPLSMPERLHNSIDSPKTAVWPQSSVVSPGQSGFRSPVYEPNSAETSSRRISNISMLGGLDQSGSYEQGVFMDQDFAMDDNGMRDLNINDRSPSASDDYQGASKAGSKRRASSPPSEAAREDRPIGSGSNDLYHRRSQQMLGSRNSPVSRFHANHGSVSSTHSSLSQRNGSYASSYGLSVQSIASSATSYSGDNRLSPGALSPSGEADFGPGSPFSASRPLIPSPRLSSLSRAHQQAISSGESPQNRKMSTESMPHSRQNSVSKLQGLYICECCPKKPKKFDGEEELR